MLTQIYADTNRTTIDVVCMEQMRIGTGYLMF